MRDRLRILINLLKEDGVLFVQIDDQEMAYLQVLLDELIGRNNRINTICVNMSNLSGVKMTAAINGKRFPKVKEYILVYAKNKDKYKLAIPKLTKEKWDNEYNIIIPNFTKEMLSEYVEGESNLIERNIASLECISLKKFMTDNNIIDSENNSWKASNSFRIFASKPNGALMNRVKDISFENNVAVVSNASGTPKLIKSDFNRETKTARIELVSAEINSSTFLGDHWSDIVTTGGVGQEGNVFFPNGKKPEKLISRIIRSATNENDIVLDSFLGSGTTAAVAHKMRRKWIGIELGEQAFTHCYVRLKSIVDSNDITGVTSENDWQGGGGFKFYTLAPSLLKKDKFDNWVISEEYNPDMLAAAMAKQEGFRYLPDETSYWKQGKSSEQDFIYTTTQFLTVETLESISEDMLPGESLLICCKAFQKECKNKFPNISIKKIPQMLLNRCEFGKDDYSFNIVNLPNEDDEPDTEIEPTVQQINDQNNQNNQPSLFD